MRLFASLGFDKIRLTGGEPTVRAHVVELVREHRRYAGGEFAVDDHQRRAVGTAGGTAGEAGLQRVQHQPGYAEPGQIQTAYPLGFTAGRLGRHRGSRTGRVTPVKINAVVVRGYNEADVVDLARLTLKHPWQVRFIEMMPFAGATELQPGQVVTASEMKRYRGGSGSA